MLGASCDGLKGVKALVRSIGAVGYDVDWCTRLEVLRSLILPRKLRLGVRGLSREELICSTGSKG